MTLLLGGGSGALLFGIWDRLLPENRPPNAQVGVTHTEGVAPLKVIISAADSSDPDGDKLEYKWRIDDTPHDSTEMTFERTFDERGVYLVSLEVEDTADHTDTDDERIEIRDKYDPAVVIRVLDNAKALIQRGTFRGPLDDLNRWRYSCAERSIPDRHCAQLHEWAGEAESNIGRMDSALDSMRKAVEHMPEDQLHAVSLADVHLLRNEPADAIVVLTDFGVNSTLGAPASLSMGIAYAMSGDHVAASTHLSRVIGGETMYRAAAGFSQLVNDALAGQTENSLRQRDLVATVCDDPSLRLVFPGNNRWVERHIRTVRVLVGRLGSGERRQLQNMTSLVQCG